MSSSGLVNQFSFVPNIPSPTYPINSYTSSGNIFQFNSNLSPIAVTAIPSMSFVSSTDFPAQLLGQNACNYVTPDRDNSSVCENGQLKSLLDTPVTVKILMTGKEVGSIIGKRGDNIKKFREESSAKINISDGNSPERIVTISGTSDQIYHAMLLICKKLDNDNVKSFEKPTESGTTTLTIRIILPALQSNNILRDGERLKQLKETTKTNIFVGTDLLPNSSEKLVTISGLADSVARCVLDMCKIFFEAPMLSYIVPYSPKPSTYANVSPNIGLNQTSSMISGAFSDISFPTNGLSLLPVQNLYSPSIYTDPMTYPLSLPVPLIPLKLQLPVSPFAPKVTKDPLVNSPSPISSIQQKHVSREFFVDNEMIGCIIGRGGATINEIRALSAAQIKISNSEDGKQERRISISGTFDAVQMAQFLINSSLEIHLQSLKLKCLTKSNSQTVMSMPSNCTTQQLLPQNPLSSCMLPYLVQPVLQLNNQNVPFCHNADHLVTVNNNVPFQMPLSQHVDKTLLKMRSTQINVDGTAKCSSSVKYKPY